LHLANSSQRQHRPPEAVNILNIQPVRVVNQAVVYFTLAHVRKVARLQDGRENPLVPAEPNDLTDHEVDARIPMHRDHNLQEQAAHAKYCRVLCFALGYFEALAQTICFQQAIKSECNL